MRKSFKRRLTVLAGAMAIFVVTGVLIALPAWAHHVTGTDITCDAVTVHFQSFPERRRFR